MRNDNNEFPEPRFSSLKLIAGMLLILILTNATTFSLTALSFTTNFAPLWIEAKARSMEPVDQDGLTQVIETAQRVQAEK